jgi:hypothetical protein
MPSCVCAVPPFREPAVLAERALVVRRVPFRDCVVPLLDALDVVRLAPFVDALLVVFAALDAVRGFGDWPLLFAEPFLADCARDAAFGVAVLRERLAVVLRLLSVDRFVVAMCPPNSLTPRSRGPTRGSPVLTPCLCARNSG